jgi:hypothetical protein
MSTINHNCPECNTELELSDDFIGVPIKCPACESEVTIDMPAPMPSTMRRSIKVHKNKTRGPVSNPTNAPLAPENGRPQKVCVVDFDMPLWSMIQFMVKWTIAIIPAAIILALCWYALVTVFQGI